MWLAAAASLALHVGLGMYAWSLHARLSEAQRTAAVDAAVALHRDPDVGEELHAHRNGDPDQDSDRSAYQADHQPEQERIAYLEQKIQTKDEVLAELMAEHVALKKRVGEL